MLPVIHPQTTPSALYFAVPFCSVFLFVLRFRLEQISTGAILRQWNALWPYLVFMSLSVLAVLLGAFGVAASTENAFAYVVSEAIVDALIQFELSLIVMYLITTASSSGIVSTVLLFVHNVFFALLLSSAFVIAIATPFLSPAHLPPFLSPTLIFFVTLFPLPTLVILLATSQHPRWTSRRRLFSSSTLASEKHHIPQVPPRDVETIDLRSGATFWAITLLAQLAGALSAVFALVQVTRPAEAANSPWLFVHTIFTILWMCAIMIACDILDPQACTQRTHTLTRTASGPGPTTFQPTSSASSDFLNLRDPFASPPAPRPYSTGSTIVDPLSPMPTLTLVPTPVSDNQPVSKLLSPATAPGPHAPTKGKRKHLRPRSLALTAKRKGSSQMLIPPASPEDADFGAEEARLASMLLRALDRDSDAGVGDL